MKQNKHYNLLTISRFADTVFNCLPFTQLTAWKPTVCCSGLDFITADLWTEPNSSLLFDTYMNIDIINMQ